MKSNSVRLFGIQLILTVICYVLWLKDSAHHVAVYVFYGSLISGTQIGLLYWLWWRIFAKKKIAPSVFAVVIKYALLGVALWALFPLNQGEMNALVVGVLTNPVAITLFALTKK